MTKATQAALKKGRGPAPPEFTVTDEAYYDALASLQKRIENPLKPLPMPESVPNPDLATVDAYTAERIVYWKGNQTMRLFFGGDFLIDVSQIVTRAQLLDLVLTLLDKPWMDTRRVRAVALRLAEIKGWKLGGV